MEKAVNRKEVMEAIQYLWGTGATLQMTSDDKYYTEILLQFAANRVGVELAK